MDFDFIKCDLNDLGHTYSMYICTSTHYVSSVWVSNWCRLIKQTALCSRLRNIYNSAGRVYT